MWNGTYFMPDRLEYSPPEYRFQAVQDGDRAFLWREYDQALSYYQQAIFDDQLKWWSPDLQRYLVGLHSKGPKTPTPAPPLPDETEYPYLAAYARYRIMLLHLKRGSIEDARVVYETLQKEFPPDVPGHPYAEMAKAFWKTFQSSKDFRQPCVITIDYAKSHSELLHYLGDTDHGLQSINYQSNDVCPIQ
jgi:hypothetical protein